MPYSVVSDLFLIMPTAGEYRVVEAVVQSCRLPVELRMCGIGPRRAAAICAEFSAALGRAAWRCWVGPAGCAMIWRSGIS